MIIAAISATTRDEDGHTLVSLWKEYRAAESSDKPATQQDVLTRIKKEAASKHLLWDWYDASERYVNVSSSRNWKERDKLQAQFEKEVDSYGEPFLQMYHKLHNWSGVSVDDVQKAEKRLKAGRNDVFYDKHGLLGRIPYQELVLPTIRNDYEFLLWCLSPTPAVLLKELEGRYPEHALAEYSVTRAEDLPAFVEKYDGKAVSLLARQAILLDRFNKLQRDGAPSSEYVALRSDCDSFEKLRKTFAASETAIAEYCKPSIKSLKSALDNKDVSASIEDGVLEVLFQNTDKVDICIETEDGKRVFQKEYSDPTGSYFVTDTLSVPAPRIDDGDYKLLLTYGKKKIQTEYRKRTISVASRLEDKGMALYPADYFSGRPVEKATLVVSRMERSGWKEALRVPDVAFSGFTSVPASVAELMYDGKRSEVELYVEYRDEEGILHRSEPVTSFYRYSRGSSYDVETAGIFFDRTAFTPGETVRYKAVVYHTDHNGNIGVCKEGEAVRAVLLDPTGKEVSHQDLETNGWGSVAGSFKLVRGGKNGMYMVEIRKGGMTLKGETLTVDDFVLPNFEIEMDPDESLHFPGEDIKVSGKIRSYSGHSLDGARIKATVSGWQVKERSFDVIPLADGSFSFNFPAEDRSYCSYSVIVKVTDVTGETKEAWSGYMSSSSIGFNLELQDAEDADVHATSGRYVPYEVVSGDVARVKFNVKKHDDLAIAWTVMRDGGKVCSGTAKAGEVLNIPLQGPSGEYILSAEVSARSEGGKMISESRTINILKLKETDSVLDAGVESVFRKVESDDIAFQFGAADGPVWAVVELFDLQGRLLHKDLVHLDGKRASAGSLKLFKYGFKPEYGDHVTLYLTYFKNGGRVRAIAEYVCSLPSDMIPLEFVTFPDKSSPGQNCLLKIKTAPGVECVASVFDKSTEAINSNRWLHVSSGERESADVSYSYNCGLDRSSYPLKYRMMTKASNAAAMNGMALDAMEADYAVEEEAIPFQLAEEKPAFGGSVADVEVKLRTDFAGTLAFVPFLHPDDEGIIDLEFKAGDKLSTFVVQLFAHDKDMKNSVLRREMLVTLPTKLSLVEPQFLYSGDEYVIKATVSSLAETALSGEVRLTLYDGADYKTALPIRSLGGRVEVGPGQSVPFECAVQVPEVKNLGIKISFVADDGESVSDALFVSVPVSAPLQTLTEAHSAVLHAGEDFEALVARLKAGFVNVDASDADVKRIDVEEMVRAAIPSLVGTANKDLLSTSAALCAGLLARRLDASTAVDVTGLERKLLDCRNVDGGFGWFEGFRSSPILTATLLQRLGGLRERGLSEAVPTLMAMTTDAVKYLDKSYFAGAGTPLWCGGLSLEQYLYVRSMYPEVAFDHASVPSKDFKAFSKEAKAYLIPTGARGLNGNILSKVRRVLTLRKLESDGASLEDAWQLGFHRSRKVVASCAADIESLLQYAVEHPDGGYYYPNAVMPWRGLLESELMAHSMLCDLMREVAADYPGTDPEVAGKCASVRDGVGLWIMLQKETQHWGDDPAFVEAVASVLSCGVNMLATEVVSVTKSFSKPFASVEAAGNGFTVTKEYLRDGKPLSDGDELNVGDKIQARYKVWSQENRSFVRLNAPRPASMRPVQQLSGPCNWAYQGYRNVLADRTEYWYDVYPEENTTIVEDLYVTQKGRFQTPAVSIESLYAPHYRANAAGSTAIVSR